MCVCEIRRNKELELENVTLSTLIDTFFSAGRLDSIVRKGHKINAKSANGDYYCSKTSWFSSVKRCTRCKTVKICHFYYYFKFYKIVEYLKSL